MALTLDRIRNIALPVGTGWLLADCLEAKALQKTWMRRHPYAIDALRDAALIQSVESSNRIEGVTVSADRLRPLVVDHARPRNRPEEEIAGYRRALDWIFTRARTSVVAPSLIRRLHKLAQHGAADAGRFKARDNEIIEFTPSGRRVRFKPTSARQTPIAIRSLCRGYNALTNDPSAPPLLTVATFVFDFLCIHPFRDGNGRVSRLLTTLLMQQHGFAIGRYISLERLIEDRKEEYYDVLGRCSKNWHDGENEIVPWWNFFLGIIRSAHQSLAEQMESPAARPGKSGQIERAILAAQGSFTLANIAAQVPAASPQLIKKVLASLKRTGRVQLQGRGRGATWRVIN